MSKKGIFGDITLSPKDVDEALKARADGGDLNYIGLDDDMVNFGAAQSFVDEGDGEREFTMRLTNNTLVTQKIQFNEILENVAGHTLLQEGTVVTVGEGASAKTLTAEGDPRSIDMLLKYIKHCPTRVRSIKFNVSDEGQLNEPIKYQKETPFMTGSTEQRIPSTYQDQKTNNTKTVEVEFKNWILGFDSTILYAIRSGVSVSMTFRFGASLDTANALRKKFNAAVVTAAKYFAAQNN